MIRPKGRGRRWKTLVTLEGRPDVHTEDSGAALIGEVAEAEQDVFVRIQSYDEEFSLGCRNTPQHVTATKLFAGRQPLRVLIQIPATTRKTPKPSASAVASLRSALKTLSSL